jgi:hypothetical protein
MTGLEETRQRNGWLTIGKEYVVLAIEAAPGREVNLQFVGDDGSVPAIRSSVQFVTTSSTLPSNWQVEVRQGGYLRLAPASWLRSGFWDDYFDRQPDAVAEFDAQRRRIEAEDAGKQIYSNPRQHLKELIEAFLDGVDRSLDHVHRIQAFLNDEFTGTALKEELEFYLAAYSPDPAKAHRIDENELSKVMCYVLALYLSEEEGKDTPL